MAFVQYTGMLGSAGEGEREKKEAEDRLHALTLGLNTTAAGADAEREKKKTLSESALNYSTMGIFWRERGGRRAAPLARCATPLQLAGEITPRP